MNAFSNISFSELAFHHEPSNVSNLYSFPSSNSDLFYFILYSKLWILINLVQNLKEKKEKTKTLLFFAESLKNIHCYSFWFVWSSRKWARIGNSIGSEIGWDFWLWCSFTSRFRARISARPWSMKVNLLFFLVTSKVVETEERVVGNLWFSFSFSSGLALLRFKQRIVSDPFNALSDWREDFGIVDSCSWFGVECSNGQVVVL